MTLIDPLVNLASETKKTLTEWWHNFTMIWDSKVSKDVIDGKLFDRRQIRGGSLERVEVGLKGTDNHFKREHQSFSFLKFLVDYSKNFCEQLTKT